MPECKLERRAAGVVAALLVAFAGMALMAPTAFALSKTGREASRLGPVSDTSKRPATKLTGAFGPLDDQHGTLIGHLPGVQRNLDLVGELNLISPSTGNPVLEGQIADVAVHKGFAYLNSWDSPTCDDGGTFVVDIRNPAEPRQVAFIPALHPFYHGEGAHVISVSTPQFTGDILAVNDETYGSNLALTDPTCAPASKTGGGFDLYNVTDPANPVPLVQGAGDRSPEGSTTQNPMAVAKSYHSVFIWQDGPRAFLVASDNTELADVDIFDITDPTDPEFIKDLDLFDLPEVNEIVDNGALGNAIFHHDVVVKRIGDTVRMLVSYWDAGYVQLNVTNPSNPTFITDTDFDDPDPLTGLDPPQGNAHQAEYSADNQFILAGDEEFAPFRLIARITQAPFAGLNFAAALSAAEPFADGALIAGDTVYVGTACTGTVAPPPAGVTIAVAERGVCAGGFQEKADAIEDAGYEMGIIFNNSFGAGGGRCEGLINMLIDPATVDIPMVFVGRADGLRILNSFPAGYQCTGAATETPADTDAPAIGTSGLTVALGSEFDGWGYAHLYDANTSEEIDAYAIPEALDERYADGFGDLSIHEFAADPTTNLAYSSYYTGGVRVFQFDRANGLQPTGAWIDEEGSNMWGVEAFTAANGERLIAASDRDFGLQILRYTGPGRVGPTPVAPPPDTGGGGGGGGGTPGADAGTPVGRPGTPDASFAFGAVNRLLIRGGRATMTIRVPGPGRVAAILRARIGRRMMNLAASQTATATQAQTGARSVRLTFRLSNAAQRSLRRTLRRRGTRRTSGVARVSFTPTGGTRLTRNRSLSIGMG